VLLAKMSSTLTGSCIRYPAPRFEMHDGLAKQLGISDGDMVKGETLRGSITIKAKVTEYIHPDVVSIPLGWENPNVNVLTSYEGRDPITEYPAFKSILCRVKRV
jgi:anaerobic selenocysteine-containing dehydrogenase